MKTFFKTGKTMKILAAAVMMLAAGGLAVSCNWDEEDYDGEFFDPGRGTLEFAANGEEFIRDGFLSTDDYEISFDHVLVNISSISAEQTSGIKPASEKSVEAPTRSWESSHAGHDSPGGDGGASIVVPVDGTFLVDLHDPAGPTEVESIKGVVAGNYDAVNFTISPISTEESVPLAPATATHVTTYAGYTMVYMGTAVNTVNGNTINFTIKLDEELPYANCGPNGARGFVPNGGTGMAEMTYHMDHVFGDGADPASDVNDIALGFGPLDDEFCSSHPCNMNVEQDDLAAGLSGEDYLTFIDALRTVGHSGEGHCHLQVH